ncbi:MAG TPA: thiamine pyrophosphate-binding protein [Acetobacteraceae bacterium]|jgi:thiamine pyrophosphate-dependent acetolactate synthase large subunit-like protein
MPNDALPLTDRAGEPIERPASLPAGNALFGSDVVADTLRALDIPFIALNPGSSYRGLHDSLVNHLGNSAPQMLLCLHEEHAIAIAHGYAKVTGRMMAAAVHANVGLMHASMAMFNAWCDRMPVLVLGATGPVDAPKRRPWIDWIHTARDQGALVRHYTKWDDQPASPEAAREALLRATWLATTPPCGPTYINLDVGMQEAPLGDPPPPLDPARFRPAMAPVLPDPGLVSQAVAMLRAAKRPLLLFGRGSRRQDHWDNRVALAEALNARVLTDMKLAAAFPTDHPLHVGPAATFPAKEAAQALAEADVVLSLDWIDLAGTLRSTGAAPKVVNVSLDHQVHNGWSMDHQGLPPADIFLAADTDTTVAALLAAVPPAQTRAERQSWPDMEFGFGPISVPQMAQTLRHALGSRPTSLLHVSLSWNASAWPLRGPLDYIGGDGGGGIGGGPGIAVGAALALRGSGRIPVAVCGDGDFLMGVTALWTAVHYGIPLLIVVANNRSFFNDELHQERVARARNRPVENRWIGQRIDDPDIDLAQMAQAQGAAGFGPVVRDDELAEVFGEAIRAVERGAVAVVDVRVAPGYAPSATAALLRG